MKSLLEQLDEFVALDRELGEEDGRAFTVEPDPLVAAVLRLERAVQRQSTDDPSASFRALADTQNGRRMAALEEQKWTPEERQIGEEQTLTRELRERRQRLRRK